MQKIRYTAVLMSFFLIVSCAIGCSKTTVSGSVSFQDGVPLHTGEVVFQSPSAVYKGTIDTAGKYTLDVKNVSGGVAAGTYKVYVAGAGHVPPGFVPPPGSDESGYVSLVKDTFTGPDTTPISCDVAKTCTFDFQVEPYKKAR